MQHCLPEVKKSWVYKIQALFLLPGANNLAASRLALLNLGQFLTVRPDNVTRKPALTIPSTTHHTLSPTCPKGVCYA